MRTVYSNNHSPCCGREFSAEYCERTSTETSCVTASESGPSSKSAISNAHHSKPACYRRHYISIMRSLQLSLGLFLACGCFWAQAPQPNGGGVRAGTLPKSWRTGGPTCGSAPEWEIHEYNPDLYILRENGCVNYEKPFLYLFFGSEKALLIDTGAGETHVAGAVSGLIDEWAKRNHRQPPPLIVGHSHSHDDHIAG